MAVWADPLDELIAELERVLPPEPPKQSVADVRRLLAELQAEAAKSVFSPEATMSDEELAALPPRPEPVPDPNSASAQIFRLIEKAREESANSTRAGMTDRGHPRPDGQST